MEQKLTGEKRSILSEPTDRLMECVRPFVELTRDFGRSIRRNLGVLITVAVLAVLAGRAIPLLDIGTRIEDAGRAIQSLYPYVPDASTVYNSPPLSRP